MPSSPGIGGAGSTGGMGPGLAASRDSFGGAAAFMGGFASIGRLVGGSFDGGGIKSVGGFTVRSVGGAASTGGFTSTF